MTRSAETLEEVLEGLKAVADSSRLRLLFALSHGELNVTELTQILDQSQPRVSQHLKLLLDAGLVTRHKEGNWVLWRLREEGMGGVLARALIAMLPGYDGMLTLDVSRLDNIRKQRADKAALFFAQNAPQWETLRALHVREDEVEDRMLHLVDGKRFRSLVDLGTGTGRVLELFAGQATQVIGLDLSREMLSLARANLNARGIRHAQIRLANLYALPLAAASADFVTIHQVLHYLDDPLAALTEARRILSNDGQLMIVDFAPHDLEELRERQAHRRLGISAEQMSAWLERAGFTVSRHVVLPPPWLKNGKGLTVSIWLAAPIKTALSSLQLNSQQLVTTP
jgi:ubiquinone/menaquinone biosynthesis C-methylase UbiE/DNA-binding HxlR family transcriptional regulator